MNYDGERLVIQYLPLANKLAHQKKRTVPDFISFEELQSAAYMGLVEAAARFNPAQGCCFSTFAYPRIRGAILDYLREQGWGKRGEEHSARSLDGDESQGHDVAQKEDADWDEMLEVMCEGLDSRAEYVLKSYLVENYSMKEVGVGLGVTESRVSQLIEGYREKIRNRHTRQDLYEMLAA